MCDNTHSQCGSNGKAGNTPYELDMQNLTLTQAVAAEPVDGNKEQE